MFDPTLIRSQFPILTRAVNGKPLAYLDSAASAQKPRAVIDSMSRVMEENYANIHRGAHTLGLEITEAFEGARAKVAAFLNAKSAGEIVFVRGATEGINLVAQSWGRANLREGDEIILTGLEHHANIVPWQMLRNERGIVLRVLPVDADGRLEIEKPESLFSLRTKLVSVTAMSNALGTLVPVEKIVAAAKAHGVPVLVDACQSIVHGPVDVEALGADFLVFSGHKIYGPTGIGVLWARREILEAMPPWQGGGDMIERVTWERTTFAPPPARFEAGTPAIVEAIGLGAAIDWLAAQDRNGLAAHEATLLRQMEEGLLSVGGVKVYGIGEKAAITSFNIKDAHPHDVAMILDQTGVAVRAGHHCAMPLMESLGIPGTVRASLAAYSNADDVAALVEAVAKAKRMLG